MKVNCLKVIKQKSPVWVVFVQAMLVAIWMMIFEQADPNAIGGAYLLVGVTGLFCMISNHRSETHMELSGKTMIALLVLSIVFSVAVSMANYRIFVPFRSFANMLKFMLCVVGGGTTIWAIGLWAVNNLPFVESVPNRSHPIRFFFLCFILCSTVYLGYLFSVAYPGYFTTDTQTALYDIVHKRYGRRLPVYHTWLIEVCLNIGWLFGGVGNAAIVVYPVLQSLALAAVCSYVLVTLYETGTPSWCLAVVMMVYTCIPYHMIYAVTIWKDVAFSIACFAIAVSLYRTVCRIGNTVGNYVVLGISSFAFCLLRTNGWYSFLLITVLLIFALWKWNRKVLLLACIILVVTWVLLNPVLDMVNPEQPDYLEALSIPLQQISLVVCNDYELADADVQLLSRYFDLEKIADLYNPYIVDPIKWECFDRSKMQDFASELGDFTALWIRWGIQHPGDYLKAWIDQTKGYWNAGYEYWIYAIEGEYEPLGIVRQTYDSGIANLYRGMIAGIEGFSLYKLFCCIGLHVWILIGCMAVNILKKRKEYLIGIPAFVIVVGLWICTPVYAEFRYAYAVLLTVPFILSATAFQKK